MFVECLKCLNKLIKDEVGQDSHITFDVFENEMIIIVYASAQHLTIRVPLYSDIEATEYNDNFIAEMIQRKARQLKSRIDTDGKED